MIRGDTTMIEPGTPAPDFELRDQFLRKISSSDYRGKKHMLLLFYPLDFTGT
jgi:peroxiredoxin